MATIPPSKTKPPKQLHGLEIEKPGRKTGLFCLAGFLLRLRKPCRGPFRARVIFVTTVATRPNVRAPMTDPTRREHDLLGDRDVPATPTTASTRCARVENFPISGIAALELSRAGRRAGLRQAGGGAGQRELGLLDDERADAIVRGLRRDPRRATARPVRRRRHPGRRGHVDQHERQRGDRQPRARTPRATARRLRLPASARTRQPQPEHQRRLSHRDEGRARMRHRAGCSPRWLELREAFAAKAAEFSDVLKMGRTQLQDAVPMTLGQEFGTYAVMLGRGRGATARGRAAGREINLGATAIGTGINAHPGYAALVCPQLAEITGIRPDDRAQPGRGDPGLRRLRAAVRRAEAHRGQAVEDLQRPAAAVLAGRAPGSTRSICRRCRRVRASCRARSIRSFPRWSTRSPSRSSATT